MVIYILARPEELKNHPALAFIANTFSVWRISKVSSRNIGAYITGHEGSCLCQLVNPFLTRPLVCTVLFLVAQSCLTLCDPMDCSPPGILSMGILQARILKWVAMPSSRGSCQARDPTQFSHIAADSLQSEPPAKPPTVPPCGQTLLIHSNLLHIVLIYALS